MKEYTFNAQTLNPKGKNTGTVSVWLDASKIQPKLAGVEYFQPDELEEHPEQAEMRYGSGFATADLIANLIGADTVAELPRKADADQPFKVGYRPQEEPLIVCEWKRGKKTVRTVVRGHRRRKAGATVKEESPEAWQDTYPDGLPCRVIQGKPTDPQVLAVFRDHGEDRRRDLFIVERLDLILLLAGELLTQGIPTAGFDPEAWPDKKADQLAMIRKISTRTKADGITLGMIREYVRDNSALTSKQVFDDAIRLAMLPVKEYNTGRDNAAKGIENPTPRIVKALYAAAQKKTAARQKKAAADAAEKIAKKANASPAEIKAARKAAAEKIAGNRIDRPTAKDASGEDYAKARRAAYNPTTSGADSKPANPTKLKKLAAAVQDMAADAGKAKAAAPLAALIDALSEAYDADTVNTHIGLLIGRMDADKPAK